MERFFPPRLIKTEIGVSRGALFRFLIAALISLGSVLTVLPAPAKAEDISVSATLEPRTVSVGEQATLVVTIKGKFRKSGRPELPQLDHVDIYDAGSSQSFSIINGAMSASISFTYAVIPRKEGAHTIEPIRFNVGNRVYTANPVTLEAVKTAAPGPLPQREDRAAPERARGKHLFIQAEVDRDTVYVNQQITWRLGFYTDGRLDLLRSPSYHAPESEGFWVEDLPSANRYYTTVGGNNYLVSEIKRAYFPTAPGEFAIGEARVEALVDDFDIFSRDDFFSRPFRSFGFGKPVTLTTDPITITVLPLLAAGKPKDFSGIVGRAISLDLRANKQVVQVGEPLNVTLEIRGEGNVKTMGAPRLPDVSGFKLYESGSSSDVFKGDDVVSGSKRYEYVLVPKVEGKRTIPSIGISYFDPVRERYEVARSPSIDLRVEPGLAEDSRRIVFTGGEDQIEVLGRDIRYIRPVPAELALRSAGLYETRLYAFLHILPAAAVFFSLAVEKRKRKWRRNLPLARAERAAREAQRKLGSAGKSLRRGHLHEVFSGVSSALWGYLADKMNASPAGLTLETVGEFLESRRVGTEEIARLKGILNVCDAVRYSAATVGEEKAREALESAAEIIKRLEKGHLG